MGEKRIDELNLEQYPSYYHYLPIDRDIEGTSKMKTDYFGRANDSSDIRCLGNTNTTGAMIPSGKYFYKYDTYHSNRVLAKAISNIAVNATLTQNTNFKYVTIGEELDALNAALTNANAQITDLKASTDVSSGFYFDTSAVKNAHVDAARNGNVITVYGYYTPISNIPSNTPFLFSGTYDMAKPVLGNDSGGIDYVSPLSHKIDVRPSGQRTANAQYYFSFTFITTTPLS